MISSLITSSVSCWRKVWRDVLNVSIILDNVKLHNETPITQTMTVTTQNIYIYIKSGLTCRAVPPHPQETGTRISCIVFQLLKTASIEKNLSLHVRKRGLTLFLSAGKDAKAHNPDDKRLPRLILKLINWLWTLSHNQQDEFVQCTAPTIKFRPNPDHPTPSPGMSGSVGLEGRWMQIPAVCLPWCVCASFMGEAAAWIALKLLVCVGFLVIQARRSQFVLCPSGLEATAEAARVAKPEG